MSALPHFNASGDLPPGIHRATLQELLSRFGGGSGRRRLIGERLRRVYGVARASGHLARFIVFGSFITDAPAPNDVDVFLLMADAFDAGQLSGEAVILFDHAAAQAYFGASIFWLRYVATLGDENTAVEHWQIKCDGTRRGIVEVTTDDFQ